VLANLPNILSNPGLSRKEKILIVLAVDEFAPKQVKDVKTIGIENGLVEISNWNISQLLKDLGANAVKLPAGWVASNSGKSALTELGVLNQSSPALRSNVLLRKYLSKVSSESSKNFLEEAVTGLEHGLLRSAVVLSWVGAVSIMYEEVVANYLTDFNNEAVRRNSKWKPAKNIDGLTVMKEHDFLQVVSAISLLGRNTKQELEQCLKLRNSCGHPSTLKLGENRVASHIEILALNVYQQFNPI
tara:strand:+ start:2432 stop:3163 length:732 start_codon:yes stop_codon:yes gene_type:complete